MVDLDFGQVYQGLLDHLEDPADLVDLAAGSCQIRLAEIEVGSSVESLEVVQKEDQQACLVDHH